MLLSEVIRLRAYNYGTVDLSFDKYARPPNSRTEMYAGRVVYCLLVSRAEYALRALLRLENGETNGRTDTRLKRYAFR